MSRTIARNVLIAVLATAALGGGWLAVNAAAEPTGPQPCTVDDVNTRIGEAHSDHPARRVFRVVFNANPGVSCTMSGSLGEVVFADSSGRPLGIDARPNPSAETITVDANNPAAVRVTTASTGKPAARIGFDLPSTAELRRIDLGWPADAYAGGIDGPVAISGVRTYHY